MAEIVGCMALSHGPQLLMPPEKWQDLPARVKDPGPEKPEITAELTLEAKQAKFKRCMGAIDTLREQLLKWKPDVVIMIGDDQRENILEDNTPPFVVYIAPKVEATRKFHYLGESPLAQKRQFNVDDSLAAAIVDGLMDAGFDPAWSRKTRYDAGLGHAFGRPLDFLLPDGGCPIVPIMVNTYYPPVPSARRCADFGKALAASVKKCEEVGSAVLVGSGGLSHVRIDEQLDRAFLRAMENYDHEYLAKLPNSVLVEGTSELRNWIITATAADSRASVIDYVPCYRTRSGIGCAMGFAVWQQ